MSHLSRIFLNKKQGMAAMQTEMAVAGSYVDASLIMTDCGRQITIDLSSHSAKGFTERWAKLQAIIKELAALEAAMARFRSTEEFKKVFK